MYICPTCNEEFVSEDNIRKHYLRCWKEHNPYHKSKNAPHSADVVTRKVNNDIADFFNSFKR